MLVLLFLAALPSTRCGRSDAYVGSHWLGPLLPLSSGNVYLLERATPARGMRCLLCLPSSIWVRHRLATGTRGADVGGSVCASPGSAARGYLTYILSLGAILLQTAPLLRRFLRLLNSLAPDPRRRRRPAASSPSPTRRACKSGKSFGAGGVGPAGSPKYSICACSPRLRRRARRRRRYAPYARGEQRRENGKEEMYGPVLSAAILPLNVRGEWKDVDGEGGGLQLGISCVYFLFTFVFLFPDSSYLWSLDSPAILDVNGVPMSMEMMPDAARLIRYVYALSTGHVAPAALTSLSSVSATASVFAARDGRGGKDAYAYGMPAESVNGRGWGGDGGVGMPCAFKAAERVVVVTTHSPPAPVALARRSLRVLHVFHAAALPVPHPPSPPMSDLPRQFFPTYIPPHQPSGSYHASAPTATSALHGRLLHRSPHMFLLALRAHREGACSKRGPQLNASAPTPTSALHGRLLAFLPGPRAAPRAGHRPARNLGPHHRPLLLAVRVRRQRARRESVFTGRSPPLASTITGGGGGGEGSVRVMGLAPLLARERGRCDVTGSVRACRGGAASAAHRYALRLGRTGADIEAFAGAPDGGFVALATRRRAMHVFAVNTYAGGRVCVAIWENECGMQRRVLVERHRRTARKRRHLYPPPAPLAIVFVSASAPVLGVRSPSSNRGAPSGVQDVLVFDPADSVEAFVEGYASSSPREYRAPHPHFLVLRQTARRHSLPLARPPPVLPVLPDGSPALFRSSMPVRAVAGLGDCVAEGLGRLRREMRHQRQKQPCKGGNEVEASVPLEFDEYFAVPAPGGEDVFLRLHADREDDDALSATTSRNGEESVVSLSTPAKSARALEDEERIDFDLGARGRRGGGVAWVDGRG
ncbi:hypothetical protein DFH06DRAFT_1330941 [Mycena polygramma]|nr:hypothetical protein DFH06DRAFT_1330941 [Mycena polygramma]